MQISLSRIEREYVLSHMQESLPAFSLISGQNIFSVAARSYLLENGCIRLEGEYSDLIRGAPLRLFFRHKQRGLYFDTNPVHQPPSAITLEIPLSIYKDNPAPSVDNPIQIRILVGSVPLVALSVAYYPLDIIVVDPDVCLERQEAMRKLRDKAGIDESGFLLSYRIFEYIDRYRKDGALCLPHVETGQLLFLDHMHIAVAVSDCNVNAIDRDEIVQCVIGYDLRSIRAKIILCGSIPITQKLSILVFKITDCQEEDKRFLYEKVYREKYQT